MKRILFAVALILVCSVSNAKEEEFVIDADHSKVGFEVGHLVVSSVEGSFKKFKGTIKFDPEHTEKLALEGTVETASVDTGVTKRDDHLRNADFFDAKKYPQIKFKSKKVEKTGDKTFKVTGDLTMKNVTKEVTFDTTYRGTVKASDKQRVAFKMTTQIIRQDFGMNFNPLIDVGPMVGKEVTINLGLEAIAKKDLG